MITFRALGIPETKGSHKVYTKDRWGRRLKRPIVRNDNEGAYDWAQIVGWAAKAAMAGEPPLDMAIELDLLFLLPRPSSVRKPLPETKPDIDKLTRCVCDALEGIVYTNDSRVCDLSVRKRYADKAVPCVQITVQSMVGGA